MLQRARATLHGTVHKRPLNDNDRHVLAQFVDAWHRRDIAGLAAVLRTDVELRMPPETAANGQLALAAFDTDEHGSWRPYGLMVFDIDGDTVSRITGFPSCELSQNPRCAPAEAFTGLLPERLDPRC